MKKSRSLNYLFILTFLSYGAMNVAYGFEIKATIPGKTTVELYDKPVTATSKYIQIPFQLLEFKPNCDRGTLNFTLQKGDAQFITVATSPSYENQISMSPNHLFLDQDQPSQNSQWAANNCKASMNILVMPASPQH